MNQPIRFAYTLVHNDPDSLMPRLSLTLHNRGHSIETVGLLDTGASVSVLPYPIGLAPGAIWEEQQTPIPLGGNLGRYEARGLILQASHPQLTHGKLIDLIFAWTRSENVPVLFGQMNFFLAFNVCFFRAENAFEIAQL